MYITFAPLNDKTSKEMDIKNILSNIILERMQVISELDEYRWLTEKRGNRYESKINILLDQLNNLNKLEKELREQLKKEKK